MIIDQHHHYYYSYFFHFIRLRRTETTNSQMLHYPCLPSYEFMSCASDLISIVIDIDSHNPGLNDVKCLMFWHFLKKKAVVLFDWFTSNDWNWQHPLETLNVGQTRRILNQCNKKVSKYNLIIDWLVLHSDDKTFLLKITMCTGCLGWFRFDVFNKK